MKRISHASYVIRNFSSRPAPSMVAIQKTSQVSKYTHAGFYDYTNAKVCACVIELCVEAVKTNSAVR
jgi:hypothetical protein